MKAKHDPEELGWQATMLELQASLRTLERREWWRWGVALSVILVLTCGIFVLSLPGSVQGQYGGPQFEYASYGLFALVVVFDLFVVYQQVVIVRMRRRLAAQIGMAATFEMLKPPPAEEIRGRDERRRAPRFHFDAPLKVISNATGQSRTLFGRVSDIGDGGLGAVIPQALESGEPVILEFKVGANGTELSLHGVVKYRRGFHHGFEFVSMKVHEANAVRKAYAGAARLPVLEP